MEKILFALDVEDGWPPFGTEGVWCERVGDNFRIKNVPFFIRGLAFNDIFAAELDPVNEHIFEFTVIERSGHSVVWLMNNGDLDLAQFRNQLLEIGCSYEGFPQFALGSIDVPPSVNFESLDELLDEYENKGVEFAFPYWAPNEND